MDDKYTVSVTKSGVVIGHLPRKVSILCSSNIRRVGSMLCEVTGKRRRSIDLTQGGLEIP
jgi:hypothetical protein